MDQLVYFQLPTRSGFKLSDQSGSIFLLRSIHYFQLIVQAQNDTVLLQTQPKPMYHKQCYHHCLIFVDLEYAQIIIVFA